MENVTQLEVQVIKQVCNMLYAYNGAIEIHPVWSNSLSIYGEVKGRRLSGACGALVRKGFLDRIDDEDGMCLQFTEEGLKLALELQK